MGKNSHHSHSHSFSKEKRKTLDEVLYDTPDERRRKLLKLSSQRDVNKLQRSFNRRQTDPKEIERVKRMFYGNDSIDEYSIPSIPKRTKWGDHYKHNPIDHDLESTIDQIRNSKGKYSHTVKKKKKLDQDTFMSVKDLEESGKLRKRTNGLGILLKLMFLGIVFVIAIPLLSDTDLLNFTDTQNLNGTSGVDQQLGGFPSFVEENLLLIVFIIPLTLFVLMITRFVF